MIARPPKYICLESYNCPCRPIGKPVSESKMKRHRAVANRIRTEQGLFLLPKGQVYSASTSRIHHVPVYTQTHLDIRRTNVEVQHQNIPNMVPSVLDPFENREHNVSIDVHNPEQGVSNNVVYSASALPFTSLSSDSGGHHPHRNLQTTNNIPVAAEEITYDIQDEGYDGHIETVVSDAMLSGINVSNEGHMYGRESSESLDQDGMVEEQIPSGEEPLGIVGTRRAAAELSFKNWAREARPWIKLYVDYAVRGTVMSEILSIIKAPISLVTVLRNLQKYSAFTTELYRTCDLHGLIGSLRSSEEEELIGGHECDQCILNGSQPPWNKFEYLPILPRVMAWMMHEPSYNTLYQYLHSRFATMDVSGNTSGYYEDFFSGELFRRIVATCGGLDNVKHDIFLGISCDGFQTFANESYDSWPIVAILLNLHPSLRFLMKNIIPMGFVKGPQKPTRLDTFFKPLRDEISRTYDSDGIEVRKFDAALVKCRVHVVFISADGPASQILSGAIGRNGKACCRMCIFHGYYCTVSRHYYYPSQAQLALEDTNGTYTKIFYDVEHPTMRTPSEIEETLRLLENNSSNMRRGEKDALRRDTGIKRRTVLLSIPSVTPYISFPLDTMHLFMNLTKDIMELMKGENSRLVARGFTEEPFVIPAQSWRSIDSDMRRLPGGTSLDAFGIPTRITTHYSKWKAIECRDFLQFYALVMLEGHLPAQYLKGLSLLCRVSRLSSKPFMTADDLEELDNAAKRFVMHFEKRYYKYDTRRVHLCKSTLHALLHLRRTVELCGPLAGCNQYWVERFIGYRKEKMHARTLPAESLTEFSKLSESYKFFFKAHFAVKDDEISGGDTNAPSDIVSQPLFPCDEEKLSDIFHSRMNTRRLLVAFLRGAEQMTESEASTAIQDSSILSYGRLRIKTGIGSQVIGAYSGRRHRKNLKRGDQFVAAEFESDNGSDRDVYYGRVSKILSYNFTLTAGTLTKTMVMVEWANRLQVNAVGEVFKPSPLQGCFRNRSIESCDVLLNSIGVIEHKSPAVRNRRTFFIDPQRDTYNLLNPGKPSPDNIDRNLRDII